MAIFREVHPGFKAAAHPAYAKLSHPENRSTVSRKAGLPRPSTAASTTGSCCGPKIRSAPAADWRPWGTPQSCAGRPRGFYRQRLATDWLAEALDLVVPEFVLAVPAPTLDRLRGTWPGHATSLARAERRTGMDILFVLFLGFVGFHLIQRFHGHSPIPPRMILAPSYKWSRSCRNSFGGDDQSAMRRAGLEGEIQVCRQLEQVVGTITYWQLAGVYRDRKFEFDHLILTDHAVVLLEVKAYTGAIYPDPGGDEWYWYNMSRIAHGRDPKIRNPVAQVKRNASILRQMLNDWGIHLPIRPLAILTAGCDLRGFGEFDVPILRIHSLREHLRLALPQESRHTEALRLAAHLTVTGAEPIIFDKLMIAPSISTSTH